MLHEIDQSVGSQVAMTDSIANPQIKNRYLQSSLIEEAIRSSQLEGAVVTREQAKAMLRSGRKPIDEAEQMILGNYRAMQLVSKYKDREMTPDLVLQIHRTIMAETTSPDASPSGLRAPEDKIAIYDERDNTLLYQSAAGSEIPDRMQALCDFANQSVAEKGFMHPVLRAILLHFWLAYDHPFTDGNGTHRPRTVLLVHVETGLLADRVLFLYQVSCKKHRKNIIVPFSIQKPTTTTLPISCLRN